MATVGLTTKDNPYNPLTEFEKWCMFDMSKGYNSCAYLGRVAKTSDALSDTENDMEIERAIDEIIEYDPFGIYQKVKTENS